MSHCYWDYTLFIAGGHHLVYKRMYENIPDPSKNPILIAAYCPFSESQTQRIPAAPKSAPCSGSFSHSATVLLTSTVATIH